MTKSSLLTASMLALLLSAAAFAQSGQSGGAQGASGASGPQGAQPATAGAQEPASAQGSPASEQPGQPASAQQGGAAEGSQGSAPTPTVPSSREPAGAPSGPASAGGSAPSSTLAATDKTFIRDAALGNLEAEEFGRLAAEKASSPEVKSFGQKIADDHKQVNDSLKKVASSLQYEPPSRPSSQAKSEKARLEKLSGAEFDREFLNLVIKNHQKDVSVLERESRRAAAPAGLKSFAAGTLQGLQDHIKMAQDLSGKLGAGSSGSPSSPQHP